MITFEKLLERAKSEKIAICTTTKKQVLKLLLELDKSEFVWKRRSKVTVRICGRAIYKFFLTFGFDKKVMFNSLKFCQDEGYTIIEFSDIDFKENE